MSEKLYFIFNGQQLLLTNKMELPKANSSFIRSGLFVRRLQLDYANSSHCAAELIADIALPADMQWMDFKALFHLLPPNIITLAGKAKQLLEWDKTHQFCGACGLPTEISKTEHGRICTNVACKRIFYPRISPVIIVAVEHNQEILLGRSPHFPPNIYSVIAGFIEPGETVEDSVHREVYEEVGIKIKNLRYFASQSWPFPNLLMLGFQADYESGNIVCAPNEIEHADFFHVDALPKTFPGSVSISQWLLQDFYKRHSLNKKNV